METLWVILIGISISVALLVGIILLAAWAGGRIVAGEAKQKLQILHEMRAKYQAKLDIIDAEIRVTKKFLKQGTS